MDFEDTLKKQKILQPRLNDLIDNFAIAENDNERIMDKQAAYHMIDRVFPATTDAYQNTGWKQYFDQISLRKMAEEIQKQNFYK